LLVRSNKPRALLVGGLDGDMLSGLFHEGSEALEVEEGVSAVDDVLHVFEFLLHYVWNGDERGLSAQGSWFTLY